ncbi:hypothetical protein [Streptomyces sp. NPDC002187]|uniref:hypothetical protein n=1 Tax=Streptomyces sp. NPDC002187 TaxID=3364637 RepID=UPI00368CF488
MEILSKQARTEALGQLEQLPGTGTSAPRTHSDADVCYAARPNSLMIRANGTISKCTVALSDPSNVVGRLAPDDTMDIDNASPGPWLRGWVKGDWAAVGCPYVGMPVRNHGSVEGERTRLKATVGKPWLVQVVE